MLFAHRQRGAMHGSGVSETESENAPAGGRAIVLGRVPSRPRRYFVLCALSEHNEATQPTDAGITVRGSILGVLTSPTPEAAPLDCQSVSPGLRAGRMD